jgi:hypothetical protein
MLFRILKKLKLVYANVKLVYANVKLVYANVHLKMRAQMQRYAFTKQMYVCIILYSNLFVHNSAYLDMFCVKQLKSSFVLIKS